MSLSLAEAIASYAPDEPDAPWRLDPVAAAKAVQGGALLVDIRSEKGRASGGIPGALIVPRAALPEALSARGADRIAALVDADKPIVLFCSTGQGSYPAAAALRAHGFGHVTDLRGGFNAWREAGFAVEAAAA